MVVMTPIRDTADAVLAALTSTASGEVDPFDPVNDPWRWSPLLGGWVSAKYLVSWTAGDVVPALVDLPVGAERVDLFVGPWSTLSEAYAETTTAFSAGPSPRSSAFIATGGINSGAITADADGTGIAFLVQYETGFAGPTAVPDVDYLTYHNPDAVFGDVAFSDLFPWPSTTDNDLNVYKAGAVSPLSNTNASTYYPYCVVWPWQRTDTSTRRLSDDSLNRPFRVLTQVVGRTANEAYWMEEQVDAALRGIRLSVGDLTSTPLHHEAEAGVARDGDLEDLYVGTSSWTFSLTLE